MIEIMRRNAVDINAATQPTPIVSSPRAHWSNDAKLACTAKHGSVPTIGNRRSEHYVTIERGSRSMRSYRLRRREGNR
jgi:hypothetical protein